MLTIPTYDLVGLLTDVLPFVDRDKLLPQLNAVRLEWDPDEERLHAFASDRYFAGWSTWSDNDPVDDEVDGQEQIEVQWGGGDGRWAVSIPYASAKEIADVFKLTGKHARTPLTVTLPRNGQIAVSRAGDYGMSALKLTTPAHTTAEFPNVRRLLTDAADRSAAPVDSIMFAPSRLAAFDKVRPHGPMRMQFSGNRGLVLVTMGETFVGAVAPQRPADPTRDTAEPDTSGELVAGKADLYLVRRAAELVIETQFAAESMIARKLRVGDATTAAILADLQAAGVVGEPARNGHREVLALPFQLEDVLNALGRDRVPDPVLPGTDPAGPASQPDGDTPPDQREE